MSKYDEGNLLDETNMVLAMHGKTLDDVTRIITKGVQITTERFKELADFTYDSGYGSQEVADIWMYGRGFIMYRWEYDGSEGWSFNKTTAKKGNVDSLLFEWGY